MCGRFTSTSTADDLAAAFHVDELVAEALPRRHNVAPTQQIYAVATRPLRPPPAGLGPAGPDPGPAGPTAGRGRPVRQLGTFRWGLVPWWAKDPSVGSRMINARAEGLATKPAFRHALEARRCLIPADAFYEWQRLPAPSGRREGRQPWVVRLRGGQPMALAGLWETWRDPGKPDAGRLRTCTIVTSRANGVVAPIHDRMPVVLAPEAWDRWLDPDVGADGVCDLLVPAPEDLFEVYPVSDRVNNVANDGPELADPLPAGAPDQFRSGRY